MKYSIVTLLMLLLSGCTTVQIVPIRTASFIDFTKYKGFYLSQASTADFKYSNLGIVTSYCKSGAEKTKDIKHAPVIPNDSFEDFYGKYSYVAATSEDAIFLLYEKAKEIGADGILNLKIEYLPDTNSTTNLYYSYSASGMAIKRE